jgi:hypothetical protein
MRRMTAMAIAAAFALFTASAFAQAKPDFSGKWTREAPAGGGAAAGGGGGGGARGGGGGGRGGGGGGAVTCGAACDIVATAASIKVSRAQGDATITWTCTLDGKDCSNEQPGRQGGAPTQVVSNAKWDGNKIVVTTKRDMGGTAVTLTSTLSIEGGKLTIVSGSSMEGAQPQTATYTKG